MAFFRYPGGKHKLKGQIIAALQKKAPETEYEYREPFFGGGSIGLELLKHGSKIKKFHINDFDPAIAALWISVIHHHKDFESRIKSYTPDVKDFELFKNELLDLRTLPATTEKIVDIAFKKLAIHQISYSGLGTKSGGPLGGKEQKSKYLIGCRWSPDYIVSKMEVIHDQLVLVNAHSTNEDFLESITAPSNIPVLLYLDPPYFVQGAALYQYGFEKDHHRLQSALKETKHSWVLSYDDCPQIRELYSEWADIKSIDVNYSINAKKTDTGRKSSVKPELVISSR